MVTESSHRPPTRTEIEAMLAATRAGRPATVGHAQEDPWSSTWQWVVAAAAVLALAWLTFHGHGWIPVLSGFDLGVHEFGHLAFGWAPTLWVQLAGSFMQIALPAAVCTYFALRRDRFAVIVTLAWVAENVNNVAVYIADATRMVLPLFNDDGSGAGHDWHGILSRLGWLGATDQLARLVRGLSVALFLAALGLAVWWFVRARRASAA